MNEADYARIKELADEISNIINGWNIIGKENLIEYRFYDMQCLDKIIRKCNRCGKQFVPKLNNRNTQKFCGIECRNQSTNEHKFVLKLDKYQRPVDLLRKSMYERIYRAKRDNKKLPCAKDYEKILFKLRMLIKKRGKISDKEYFKEFAELKKQYNEITKLTNK